MSQINKLRLLQSNKDFLNYSTNFIWNKKIQKRKPTCISKGIFVTNQQDFAFKKWITYYVTNYISKWSLWQINKILY